MSESAKIRPQVLSCMMGETVLDLGCGLEKIVPWAVGVDDGREQGQKTAADISATVEPHSDTLMNVTNGKKYKIVFSSHTLEHMRAPIAETLRHWWGFVEPGGLLILYLPDERRYLYDPANPKVRNPAHWHYLEPVTFRMYLEQIRGLVVDRLEEDPQEPGRYSFLVVARKSYPYA